MSQIELNDARAEFLLGSTEIGVLVIHGFTGTTQSMRPIAYALFEKGYTVNLICLKGHGTSPEDLEECTYNDWIESVKAGYDLLKSRVKEVFIVGFSIGGTLTLYSAISFDDVKGVVTINAAVDIPNHEALYNDPNTPRFTQGNTPKDGDFVGSDIKKKGVFELCYDRTPKKSIKEIVDLTKLVKKDLSKITCPILVISSTEDHVVPPSNQKYIFEHVSSKNKKLVELTNSYHVAPLDNDFDLLIKETLVFLEEYK